MLSGLIRRLLLLDACIVVESQVKIWSLLVRERRVISVIIHSRLNLSSIHISADKANTMRLMQGIITDIVMRNRSILLLLLLIVVLRVEEVTTELDCGIVLGRLVRLLLLNGIIIARNWHALSFLCCALLSILATMGRIHNLP